MKRLTLLLIPILIWGASCKQETQVKEEQPKSGDVYVAGAIEGKAVFWKNGMVHHLSDGTLDAEAKSVYVSGSDVFVAGRIGSKAVLWKNGIAQNLSDDGGANSVYVSGGDVYVAGRTGNCAVLWKNEETLNLFDGAFEAEAQSVVVFNNDVYVAGNKFWKNGEVQKLTDGTDHPGGSSVFVSNGDVYVAGSKDDAAIVWINGIAQHLEGGNIPTAASANSVFVSGSDVYVAGGYTKMGNMPAVYGRLWKNGKNIMLHVGAGGESEYMETTSHSVYVSGDDVYLVGNSVPRFAFLWKNGEVQFTAEGVNDRPARAYSVFVVK